MMSDAAATRESIPAERTTGERSTSIDALKGISIIAVVMIHARYLLPFKENNPIFDALDWCVPVFIVVGVYLLAGSLLKPNRPSLWQWIGRRELRLLIPFVFWSLAYGAVSFIGRDGSLHPFQMFNGFAWSGQYFFILLAQIVLLVVLLEFVLRFDAARCWVYAAGLTTIALWQIGWGLGLEHRVGFFWLPYVILGLAYARKNLRWPYGIPTGIAAIGVAVGLMFVEEELRTAWGFASSSNYLLISSLLASALIFLVGRDAITIHRSSGVVERLAMVGRYSLGIFCLNPLVASVLILTRSDISDFAGLRMGSAAYVMLGVLFFFAATGVSLVLCILIEKLGGRALVR